MPLEQPLGGERLGIVTGCIQHHLDDAFDVAVGRLERAYINAEAAGDGGTDLFGVQPLALDLAAFQHVLGEYLKGGLLAEIETKSFHGPKQPTLLTANSG